MNKEKHIEEIAKMMCIENGWDPKELIVNDSVCDNSKKNAYYPAWESYIDLAEKIVNYLEKENLLK
jgi:hypothetical protein